MNKIITLLLFYLSISVFPQTYNDFAQEIFFGRLPSAKTEAMGRILTLNFDSYFISQSNPANLAATKGIAGFYSHSSPLYGYNEATYNYAGVSYNNATVGAFAFNFLSFKTGMTFYVTEEGGPEIIGTFEPGMDLYTLTYANEIAQWFSFGINANLFINHLGEDQSFTGTFFELGLSRDFHLISDSQIKDDISIGTQLKNIFNQSFSAIDEAQADAFPSIFRVGISNTTEYTDTDAYKNSYLLGFTLGIEYQNLFNSDYRTAYKAGAELSLLDILFLRGGFYHETTIDYGFNLTGKLEEFTYGLGLKLDFYQLFTKNFPLVLLFDYVSLKQPTYIIDFDDCDNFTAFTLIANYKLNL
jgi:hypothetical protein